MLLASCSRFDECNCVSGALRSGQPASDQSLRPVVWVSRSDRSQASLLGQSLRLVAQSIKQRASDRHDSCDWLKSLGNVLMAVLARKSSFRREMLQHRADTLTPRESSRLQNLQKIYKSRVPSCRLLLLIMTPNFSLFPIEIQKFFLSPYLRSPIGHSPIGHSLIGHSQRGHLLLTTAC